MQTSLGEVAMQIPPSKGEKKLKVQLGAKQPETVAILGNGLQSSDVKLVTVGRPVTKHLYKPAAAATNAALIRKLWPLRHW